MNKIRFATTLANILDHFDSALYGLMVPIIAPLFFKNSDSITCLIEGYGIVLIGLITRPLGAWYFSYIAQKQSPQLALIRTIQGMTIATIGFVMLQPYDVWGIWGAVGLCILKALQSFFGSGEVSIAGLYILENTKPQERHPIASQFASSTMVGIGLAMLTTSVLFYLPNPAKYWKWPFYCSAITALASWWLRQTTSNQKLTPKKVRIHWPSALKLAPITGLSYIFYSVSMVFFTSFAAQVTAYPIADFMFSNNLLMILDVIFLILFGQLFKNFQAVWLLKRITYCTIVIMPFLFWITPSVSFFGILCIRIILVILGTGFCIPLYRYYFEVLPESIRYNTAAIGYAIGTEIFGRSFPLIGFLLWQKTQLVIAPALYICFIGIMTLAMLKALKPVK